MYKVEMGCWCRYDIRPKAKALAIITEPTAKLWPSGRS